MVCKERSEKGLFGGVVEVGVGVGVGVGVSVGVEGIDSREEKRLMCE